MKTTIKKSAVKFINKSVKDIRKAIKNGEQRAFNHDHKPLPSGYLAKRADQSRVIPVYFVKVSA